MTDAHHPADALRAFAAALLRAAGMDDDKAATTAAYLVLTDMMGRRTHGLAQLGPYLTELASGGQGGGQEGGQEGNMTGTGEPETLRDTGATLLLDGGYHPGLWLVDRAMRTAFERIGEYGVVTVSLRKSHHIGCLAALARTATERGLVAIIASSGPHTRIVVPHGGRAPLLSPNPFAIGIPATASPILVDISASLTSLSTTREKAKAGARFAHPWLADEEGRPTTDPTVIERGGGLLLLGGTEAGHKGFGLALMVEALTGGLAGFGRREAPTRWGANVFLQVLDPEAFGGRDDFLGQMDFLAEACRATPPADPAAPVRLPGDGAARSIAAAERDGVPLSPGVAATLRDWSARLGTDASLLG